MSNPTSPVRYSVDLDHFYDPDFTAEISQRMRVPKRINVVGENEDRSTRDHGGWVAASDKIEMHVPEKIIVAGQGEHYGTRSLPREMSLETTIMPADMDIRVQTPPKVITIDSNYCSEESLPLRHSEWNNVRPLHEVERRVEGAANVSLNESQIVEGMTVNEEVVHLRRQLAKLNRRVMSIELESMQRQQRDKILYALGLAYFFLKSLFWLSRSN